MRVLVVGLAATGASVVSYTRAAGHDVTVVEDRRRVRLRATATAPGSARRSPTARRVLERPDAGPMRPRTDGPPTSSCRARACIPTTRRWSPRTPPASRCAPRSTSPPHGCGRGPTRPIVAVTGTNGKTTVTTLIDAMLARRRGSRASRPATSGARCSTPPATTSTWSSPRCRRSSSRSPPTRSRPTSPCCSTWPRTISTGTARLDAYAQAKAELFAAPGRVDALLVFNADDPVATGLAADAPGRVVRFGDRCCRRPATTACVGGRAGRSARTCWPRCRRRGHPTTSPTRSPRRPPRCAVGADVDAVARALAGFGGLPHRVQLVGEPAACGTTTTRRRRTRTPPPARWPGSSTSC